MMMDHALETQEDLRQEVVEGLRYVHHQLGANTNKALETASFLYALIELLMQIRVLALQPSLFERGVENVHQLVELKRLRDEIRDAHLRHVDGVLHRSIAGDHDRDDAGIAGERGLDDRAAVDARQPEVGDDDVEGETVDGPERGLAVRGFGHLVACVPKSFSYNTSQGFLVVYEEEVRHGLSKY